MALRKSFEVGAGEVLVRGLGYGCCVEGLVAEGEGGRWYLLVGGVNHDDGVCADGSVEWNEAGGCADGHGWRRNIGGGE